MWLTALSWCPSRAGIPATLCRGRTTVKTRSWQGDETRVTSRWTRAVRGLLVLLAATAVGLAYYTTRDDPAVTDRVTGTAKPASDAVRLTFASRAPFDHLPAPRRLERIKGVDSRVRTDICYRIA